MLIWFLFIGGLVQGLLASSRCFSPNATTYLRSESTRLMEFSTKILKDVTLNECAKTCSDNAGTEQCLSFEYDSSILQCSQHTEDGQPFGASVLAKAVNSISFFQQICLLEEAICSAPYAFERYPQSILVGHAMYVITVDGLSDCLSKCALLQTFTCKSAMYYYETGECIMNRDTKFIYPQMFRTGIQDTLVDYFENNCADVSCSSQETLHWIRTEEYSIDESKDVIVESSEAQQCSQLCQNNKIGEETFPCRAFAFSNSKQECHLTADSSYIGHKGDKKFNLAPLSSGEYFEKHCLKTNLQCVEASFELLANRMMITNYKTLTSLSPHQCLAQCMQDGPRCASVTYFYLDDQCQLSDVSQFSKPDQFVTANFTDYFDKICDPAEPANFVVRPLETPPELVENKILEGERNLAKGAINYEISTTTVSSINDIQVEESKDLEAIHAIHQEVIDKKEMTSEVEGTVIDDAEQFNSLEDPTVPKVKARLSTECRMSGISVSINFEQPTSGTLYIKDHYSSCRQRFENQKFAELHIPFPNEEENSPRCGGTQIEPAKWEFTAVVERNSLESPSIVTSSDKSFQITCDYSKILDKHQLADLKPKYEGDQKSAKILMEIVRNGRAVSTVPLGEEIELRWTVIDPLENVGFFINECIAERVGGAAPHPEPLKIIYQGCPEEKVRNRLLSDPVIRTDNIYSTKMKVFRFDGSRRVRIKCSIDVCVESCPPVICDDLDVRNIDSYGRKKREISIEKWLQKGKNKTTKKRKIVAGTLTILDRDEKQETSMKNQEIRSEYSKAPSSSHFCVQKSHIEILVIVGVLIILFQIAFIIICYKKFKTSTSSDDHGSMYSESNTSSKYNTVTRPTPLPRGLSSPSDSAMDIDSHYSRLHLHHFR